MSAAITVIIVISIIAPVILAVCQLVFERTNENIGRAIVETGIALVLTAIPSVLEIYAGLFSAVLGVKVPILCTTSEAMMYVCMAIGLVLIVFGYIIIVKMKSPVYVLNMVGHSKREIGTEKNEKSLKIADYKIKEQVIDIIPIFDNGRKIDKRANEYIIHQIERDVQRFSDRTDGNTSCFTGMAPIPYTILAGTYLSNANVVRYFEFDRYHSESYYELTKNKFFDKAWPTLEEVGDESKTDDDEVVLSISVSHKVLDGDLKCFGNKPVVHLSVPKPADNLIRYTDQLLTYKNVICRYVDSELKERYKNLKKIHLAASIPSCLSLEIGKSFGAGSNRIPPIVAYHYISSADSKYIFGIFVSGENKGKLS